MLRKQSFSFGFALEIIFFILQTNITYNLLSSENL